MILGWMTVAATGLTAAGCMRWLWLAGQRPWLLLPRPPVPQEAPRVEWVVPDEVIPWI